MVTQTYKNFTFFSASTPEKVSQTTKYNNSIESALRHVNSSRASKLKLPSTFSNEFSLFSESPQPYLISNTLIGNVNKKFISCLARHLGSYHDAYVFSNMKLAQHPQRYLGQDQFLLANSGYIRDQYVFPAYKGAELLD
ncbi:hypothetical protein H4Q26_006308 [Puccinia striiformis f. sp. tritici PST-130]|nr:hypothetical protein H4Q26_006308 [Puccinia striiformis f. sp. tritici PST-130]